MQEAFYGAFGLANRGIHNVLADYNPQTGKTRYMQGCEDYRAYLEYLHRLYAEGLMDPHIFSITVNQWGNYAENDRIGAFVSTNLAMLPASKTGNWVAVDEALAGPGGHKLWTAIRANFHSVGAAAIPATCEDPALALRWLDYFWTDEGTLFYHMGVENETFVIAEDGAYDYADRVYAKMRAENLSFDDVVATISPYPGGGNPTVEVAPIFAAAKWRMCPPRPRAAFSRTARRNTGPASPLHPKKPRA